MLDFSIAPAWYQTDWFRAAAIIAFIFGAWSVHQARLRRVAHSISQRFDERLAERTRMARELHDTYLQTIQGSKMVADDALDGPADPTRLRHALQQLSEWLEKAQEEGRAALHSLRASTTERNDLAEAFRRATQGGLIASAMAVDFSVVGESREMHAIVRDEVYRIGYEAIRNAYAHSRGSHLKVELTYDKDLALRVSDNGVGIGAAVSTGGKPDHFGLQGMRERASRIGAKLTITSSPESGTDIVVVVPGAISFLNGKPLSVSWTAEIFRLLRNNKSR